MWVKCILVNRFTCYASGVPYSNSGNGKRYYAPSARMEHPDWAHFTGTLHGEQNPSNVLLFRSHYKADRMAHYIPNSVKQKKPKSLTEKSYLVVLLKQTNKQTNKPKKVMLGYCKQKCNYPMEEEKLLTLLIRERFFGVRTGRLFVVVNYNPKCNIVMTSVCTFKDWIKTI